MAFSSELDFNKSDISFDVSGILKTSSSKNIGLYKKLSYNRTELFSDVGTGTSNYSNNSVLMSVSSGQYRIRETKKQHQYIEGNPQTIECTSFNFHSQSGVTKRIGYFNSNTSAPYNSTLDGIFIEDDGTNKYIKTYNNGTETSSVIDTSWDNYELVQSYNWQNFTAIRIEFLWLGGVGYKFYVAVNGNFKLIHEYSYTGLTTSYIMLSPCHSVRYELRSSTGSGTLTECCMEVSTVGSLDPDIGYGTDVDTGITGITMSNSSNQYLLIAMRKAFIPIHYRIQNIKAYSKTKLDVNIRIVRNPTISGTLTWATLDGIQYVLGNGTTNTATGGKNIDSDSTSQGLRIENESDNFDYDLRTSIDGTQDIIAIVAQASSNNAAMIASMKALNI